MAFKDDDVELALAVLRLCDAHDDGATNAEARQQAVNMARKHAHRVLDRGKRKQDITPAEMPEGDTEQ